MMGNQNRVSQKRIACHMDYSRNAVGLFLDVMSKLLMTPDFLHAATN